MTVFLRIKVYPRNSRLHRGCNDCCRYATNHPGIEWFWNDVLWTEPQVINSVNSAYGFRNILLRQFDKGSGRGQHHLLVDSGCACIECSAEDSREAEDIIHLVRVV